MVVTYLAAWIVGAALTYWLAEREMNSLPADYLASAGFRRARREVAIISAVAWPCALAIYLLSVCGVIGDDDDEGDA